MVKFIIFGPNECINVNKAKSVAVWEIGNWLYFERLDVCIKLESGPNNFMDDVKIMSVIRNHTSKQRLHSILAKKHSKCGRERTERNR